MTTNEMMMMMMMMMETSSASSSLDDDDDGPVDSPADPWKSSWLVNFSNFLARSVIKSSTNIILGD